MNHPGAVEAVSGAQGPLATLQALAEAVGALAAAPSAEQGAAAAQRGSAEAQAPGTTAPAGLAHDAADLAAQAAQGRMTLGQLAAEQSALRPGPHETLQAAAAPLLRAELAPDGLPAQRLPDLLAVPVLVTALFAQAGTPARPQATERRPAPAWPDDHHAAPWPDPAPGEEDGAETPSAEEAAAPVDAEAAALCALLRRAGQSAALAELARGRRVLLVLPQAGSAPVPAQAWLLSATRAQRHLARWWPGLAAADGWPSWRVFRDGDPQLGRGLASRAAGLACRVRLGVQPPRLVDAGAASVEIAERIRFAQALGGQWSLLLLVAPAGMEA